MPEIKQLNLSSSDLVRSINSPDWRIRAELAYRGNVEDLEKLVNDPAWQVRKAVAFSGKDKYLKMLEDDESSIVRQEVARQRRFNKEIQKW